jgi:hypothetical protein
MQPFYHVAAGLPRCQIAAILILAQELRLPNQGEEGVARAPGAGVADQRSQGWRSAGSLERAEAWKAGANVRRWGMGIPGP